MRQCIAVVLILTLKLVLGQDFRCALEKIGSSEHCVFRDVKLGKNTAGARFTYPDEVPKPSQVAFLNSDMTQLPSNFLSLAGPELKVLRVEGCGLELATITSGLEEMYAKDNSIGRVIVHQSGTSGPLRTLDLSGNQLDDISNVTKCQSLEMLNLSGNKLGNTLELGKFKGLNMLRKLDLTYNDIYYLDNTGDVNLQSLEELDLSYNNIVPSDLRIRIFYPYTKLHTLRLNNNLMIELDYNHLLSIKSLKTVYLNGNNFKCTYLDVMLKHLQQNGLQTPPGESTSCQDRTLNEFCCTGSLPPKPTPPTTPPETRTTTERTIDPSPPEETQGSSDDDSKGSDSPPSWMWFAVGAGVAIVVIAAVIGVVVWKNQQKNYRVPPGNMELS